MGHGYGLRRGKWSKRQLRAAEKIAEAHESTLEYLGGISGVCACGSNCRYGACKAILTVWFEGPNDGTPWAQIRAREVEAELKAANLLQPKAAEE